VLKTAHDPEPYGTYHLTNVGQPDWVIQGSDSPFGTLKITVGDVVVWSWDGLHNAHQSSGPGDGISSGASVEDGSFSHVFDVPGVYKFISQEDPDMLVKIQVLEAPGAALCGDGDICNGQETCQGAGLGSECVEGAPPQCDDGLVCNGEETCDPLDGCEAGVPVDCPGGYGCLEETGECACDEAAAEQGLGCSCEQTAEAMCVDGELMCVCEPWVYPTLGEIWGSPVELPSGNVAFGNFFSRMYSVTPQGEDGWETPTTLGGAVQHAPAYDPGSDRLFVADLGGILYAFEPSTGEILDSVDLKAPPSGPVRVMNDRGISPDTTARSPSSSPRTCPWTGRSRRRHGSLRLRR